MPVQIIKTPKPQAAVAIIRREMDAALRDTGRFVAALAKKYPPQSANAMYRRTGTLGRSITIGKTRAEPRGRSIEVGTNKHYAPYVEYGTGIYGPKKQKIEPKNGKVLAWRAQAAQLLGVQGGKIGARFNVGLAIAAYGISKRKGKIKRNVSRDVYAVFARSVRGMKPWHFMEQAFKAPETAAYFKQRLQQMWARINAAL